MARPAAHTITVATPERILSAAEREFSELGFGGATLATIAKGAQITRASLLHHFPSKEELYQKTVERAFNDLGQALTAEIGTQQEFIERLFMVLNVFYLFCEKRPGVARLITRQVIEREGPGRTLLLEQAAPLLDLVEAFIASEGKSVLREGLDVRGAVMRVVSNVLLRASSDDLRVPLWGRAEDTVYELDNDWTFACVTFLQQGAIDDALKKTAAMAEATRRQARTTLDDSSEADASAISPSAADNAAGNRSIAGQ